MNEHSVTYTNTALHIIWFAFKHGLRLNVIRILYALLILGTAVNLFLHVKPAFSFTKMAFILGVCVVLALLFVIIHLVLSALMYLGRKDPSVLTSHTVTLNEIGVSEITPVSRSEQTWASVHKVLRDGKFFLLYAQRHAAHVIPIGAFSSESEAEKFYEFACARWKSCR